MPSRARVFWIAFVPVADVRHPPLPRSLFGRYFKSDTTGLWVYHKQWRPAAGVAVKGVVFISHGFDSHFPLIRRAPCAAPYHVRVCVCGTQVWGAHRPVRARG